MDPFAAALVALFNAPGCVAANYTVGMGATKPIRVIRDQGTHESQLANDTILLDSNTVQIMRSDVAEPRAGDDIVLLPRNADGSPAAPQAFTIKGGARLDLEGLTWTCALVEV